MQFTSPIRRVVMGCSLLVLVSCKGNELTGPKTKESEIQKVVDQTRDQSTQPAFDGQQGQTVDNESMVAADPVPIGGAYLIEPKLVTSRVSANYAEMEGAPGSIKPSGDTKNLEAAVELLAFDTIEKPMSSLPNGLDLSVRVVSKVSIAADGSFRVQGEFRTGELLFLRTPAPNAKDLRIDTTKNDPSSVWYDSDRAQVRRLDIPAAHALLGLLNPSATLLANIQRLLTTFECRNCQLSGAELRVKNINGADLTGAVLIGAKFVGSTVTSVKFNGADLRGADFIGSNLAFSDFNGAKLEGVFFQGSSIEAAVNLSL